MTYVKRSRELFSVLLRNHNVCPECAVYDNLSVPLHPALENRRAAMMKRAVWDPTRVVVRKLWHLTMRASRTGVINLKPIGEEGGRRGEARANDTTTVAAGTVVTNYLDARGVRVADAVGTGCSARLAGTVGVPLRYVCTVRGLDDEPANGTSVRRIMNTANKTSCTDVCFHGRDPADGRWIDLIGEIGSLFCSYVFEIKSLACSIKHPFFNANLKQTRSVTLLRCNRQSCNCF